LLQQLLPGAAARTADSLAADCWMLMSADPASHWLAAWWSVSASFRPVHEACSDIDARRFMPRL